MIPRGPFQPLTFCDSVKGEEECRCQAKEKKNVSIKIEQKLSSRHVLGGRMADEEESIEGATHNMGFVWEDVSMPYSGSDGQDEHNETLFPVLPLFLRSLTSVCGTERSQMKPISPLPCCLRQTVRCGVLYTCFICCRCWSQLQEPAADRYFGLRRL